MTLRVHPDEIVRSSKSSLLTKHESWERVRLRDVADVLNGFAFKSKDFTHDGGVPLLRIRDVGSSTTQIRYTGDYDSSYMVDPGTIVVGMDGDFRAARWNGPPALLNQRVCTITVRDEALYNSTFLLHALPGYLDAINDWTSSITVKHLSSETIKEIPLPLPPVSEQGRVVAAIEQAFSRLDEAHDSLQRAQRRLRDLKAAALAAALKGWPESTLGDLAEVFIGTTPSRSTPELWEGDVPWVSSGEVAFCRIHRTRETISPVAVTSADRLHPPGTVLLAMIGEGKTRGQAAILDVAATHNQNSAAIRLDSQRCAAEWLFYVLMARYEETRRAGSGAQQPALNRARVQALSIPLPPLEDQVRLVEDLERQLSLVAALTTDVDRAQRRSAALRRSILEEAFNGKLVVQDPEDEPAAVLLERIARQRAAIPKRLRRSQEKTPA
jgi:type I restriction enzyme S subunit